VVEGAGQDRLHDGHLRPAVLLPLRLTPAVLLLLLLLLLLLGPHQLLLLGHEGLCCEVHDLHSDLLTPP
jgi:hypothetical protein